MAKLEKLDPTGVIAGAAATIAVVKGLHAQATGMSLVSVSPAIGPELMKSAANKMLKKEAKKHLDAAKIVVIALVMTALVKYVSENPPEPPDTDEIIRKMNPVIKKLNGLILVLKTALDILKAFIMPIFVVIIIVTVVYIVAKIVSMIPMPMVGAGVGAIVGVSFTSPVAAMGEIKIACESILTAIKPIPFSIIAIMMMILGFLTFLNMIVGLLSKILGMLLGLKNDAISDNLKTASDWSATSTAVDDRDQMSRSKLNDDGSMDNKLKRLDLMIQLNQLEFQGNLVACTLPGGEVKQMTPEDCLAAGGTFGDLVTCTLPDGSTQQMTPDDCLAAGGTFGDNRADLLYELNNLGGPLSDSDLLNLGNCTLPDGSVEQMTLEDCLAAGGVFGSIGDLIITSLLHPDIDVTVRKATDRKGKRIGFYQSDIKQ